MFVDEGGCVELREPVALTYVEHAVVCCPACRTACTLAFGAKRRSMLAGDVLEHLGVSVDDLFEHHVVQGGHVQQDLRKPGGGMVDW
jgi:hypothetical protein